MHSTHRNTVPIIRDHLNADNRIIMSKLLKAFIPCKYYFEAFCSYYNIVQYFCFIIRMSLEEKYLSSFPINSLLPNIKFSHEAN